MNIEASITEHLRYDPVEGKVYWVKHPRRTTSNGLEAGNINIGGYRKLKFQNKQYLVHRIAWILYFGKWPEGELDHIDGNKLNNKIQNLRDVSHRVNLQNRTKPTSLNKTGFVGVVKRRNKYQAYIHRGGKQIYLGLFTTPELAHKAYKENAHDHTTQTPTNS